MINEVLTVSSIEHLNLAANSVTYRCPRPSITILDGAERAWFPRPHNIKQLILTNNALGPAQSLCFRPHPRLCLPTPCACLHRVPAYLCACMPRLTLAMLLAMLLSIDRRRRRARARTEPAPHVEPR